MKALVDLLEKYQPGIAQTFEPAPDLDLELIEEEVGPLPGAYVRFLKTMGASMGEFELSDSADLSVNGVWEMNKQMSAARRQRFIYIGQDNSGGAMDYFLDRRAPHGEDDCMVVCMPLDESFDPKKAAHMHAGLEEFLYYEAYRNIRLPLFEYHKQLLRPQDPALAKSVDARKVCNVAEELGFTRIPRVTSSALYERGDAAMLLQQVPQSPRFSFIVSSNNEKELNSLADLFCRRTGVVEHPNFAL